MSDSRIRVGQRGDGDGGFLIVAILLVIFLFHGEPDVWDRLHAYAMKIGTVQQCDKPLSELTDDQEDKREVA